LSASVECLDSVRRFDDGRVLALNVHPLARSCACSNSDGTAKHVLAACSEKRPKWWSIRDTVARYTVLRPRLSAVDVSGSCGSSLVMHLECRAPGWRALSLDGAVEGRPRPSQGK